MEIELPKEKSPQKEQIKVTDKRIFTPEGDIREEFRKDIRPSEPSFKKMEAPAAAPTALTTEKPAAKPSLPPTEERRTRSEGPPPGGDRRRTLADKAQNPGTAFSDFVEPLIAQAYMSLGMLRNPYQPAKPAIDASAARQMIEILTMLQEKTAGNLTPDEEDFLTTHLGELKLAFVQRTKSL